MEKVHNVARLILAPLSLLTALHSSIAVSATSVAGSNSSNGRVFGICFDDANGDGQPDPRTSASADGGTTPVALAFYLDPLSIYANDAANARKLFVADEKGRIRALSWPSPLGDDKCNFTPVPDNHYQYDAATASAGPANPNGLSVTRGRQLLVLDSKAGNVKSQLWRFDLAQGHLGTPLLLDEDVKVNVNGETVSSQFLEEGLSLPNGDFLVASSDPRAILRYKADCIAGPGPCPAETLLGPDNLSGTPAGIALAPAPLTSKLLVSATNGTVEVYDMTSTGTPVRQANPLISGLNQGRFKIKTLRTVTGSEYQQYAGDLYLAGRNNGQIIQLNILDQNGELAAPRDEYGNFVYQALSSVQFPVGLAATEVDTASATECASATGCNITPAINHRIVAEHPIAGDVGEQYEIYPDPRTICGGNVIPACPPAGAPDYSASCDNSISLRQLNPAYEDVRIPGNLCGSPNIAVVDVNSSIDITSEVIEHTVEYSNISDALDCHGSDRSRQPVVAWATKAGEDPVVEGQKTVDVTSGCGSVRAGTREYSYFVFGLRYLPDPYSDLSGSKKSERQLTDLFVDIVRQEITALRATFEEARLSSGGSCVVDPDNLLGTSLSDLETDFDRGQHRFAQEHAQSFAGFIEADSSLVSPKNLGCSENFRGELQTRAIHIWYNINSKVLDKPWGSY
ncbi:hypothetical protein [Microbulbifer hydrolyticus]|uniref:Uncharacterized protein n=1 Tax=Microbulbifer hydrolyticus TaxID=48074 RepID=A0A6P1TCN3_9GAMM|nr:hypothetical protein [Microbulbifer hydrolyticus]MBB5210084.1 hypothetical protein [Microbulbifer hydrolyticus]QHQ39396.1 hypothetical protein GTQ55_10680 [Microbulbifer hydrolyticus]